MELGFLRHSQGQRLDRLGLPFKVAGKLEPDLHFLDARGGDHPHLVPLAARVAGFDAVAEVTRGGGDAVFEAAVADLEFHLARASLAGAEVELRLLGNDPRHADHDLGAVPFLHH